MRLLASLLFVAVATAQDDPAPQVSVGAWKTATAVSPIDDSTTVVLILKCDPMQDAADSDPRPVLVIRHREGSIEAIIDTGYDVARSTSPEARDPPHAQCVVRFGKEKAERWPIDTSPSGRMLRFGLIGSRHVISRMLATDRLAIRFSTVADVDVTACFNLTGLREAIKPLLQASGWSPGSLQDVLSLQVAAVAGMAGLDRRGAEFAIDVDVATADYGDPHRFAAVAKAVALCPTEAKVAPLVSKDWKVRVTLFRATVATLNLIKHDLDFTEACLRNAFKSASLHDRLDFVISDDDPRGRFGRIEFIGVETTK